MKSALLLLSLATAPAAADGFKAAAKELSAAARKARIERVAVMPFVPADGSDPKEGWNVSERFVTQLVRGGKVKAVERSLLRKLLEEHRLGETGALDPRTLKKLGQVFSAEGIVTGSFVTSGRRLIVNARLIDVETGVIVAACERSVEKDWSEPVENGRIYVPVPQFTVEAPTIESDDSADLRDSVADDSCDGAATRVDRLEEEILDLKARYWALRLREGLKAADVKRNPGSTISDPGLKQAFYERLKAWHAQPAIPALSPREIQRFIAVDAKAYSLYQRCGI